MVPNAEEICQAKLLNFVGCIEKQEFDEQSAIAPFIPEIIEKLSHFSTEELIKKIIASEFETVNKYYQNAEDLNIADSKEKKKTHVDDNQMSRLFINIGKIDRIRPGDVIGLINKFTRDINEKIAIGHIDLMRNFSFVDVDSTYAQEIINRINGQSIDGYKLVVELTENKRKESDFGGFGGKKKKKGKSTDYKDNFKGNKGKHSDRKDFAKRDDWRKEKKKRK